MDKELLHMAMKELVMPSALRALKKSYLLITGLQGYEDKENLSQKSFFGLKQLLKFLVGTLLNDIMVMYHLPRTRIYQSIFTLLSLAHENNLNHGWQQMKINKKLLQI